MTPLPRSPTLGVAKQPTGEEMSKSPTMQDFDEIAAEIVGHTWLAVAIAAALIDAGAIKKNDLLTTLDGFADFVTLELGENMASAIRQAIDLLEASGGDELSNAENIELTTSLLLLERLRGRSIGGIASGTSPDDPSGDDDV